MMNVLLMCPSKYDAQINSRPCLSRSLFLSVGGEGVFFLYQLNVHTFNLESGRLLKPGAI